MNSVMPIIDVSDLKVVPCAYSTGGTALKPAVQYDPLNKANTGLSFPISVDYIKKHSTWPQITRTRYNSWSSCRLRHIPC